MIRFNPYTLQKPQPALHNRFWTTMLVLIGLVAFTVLSADWNASATFPSATNAGVEQTVAELDVEGLIHELEEDPSADTRSRAAKALGLLNDARAVNVLERAAASDPSVEVRDAANKALASLKEYWARIAGKNVEYVGALVVAPNDSNTVYLAELNELSISRDGGATWTTLGNPLPSHVSAIAIDPLRRNVMYAGIDSLGLYKSTDGGGTWHAVNDGLGLAPGVRLRITALAIDPENPEHIFAARGVWIGTSRVELIPLGLMESHDGGRSWYSVDVPEFAQAIGRLVVTDGKLYAAAGEEVFSIELNAEDDL